MTKSILMSYDVLENLATKRADVVINSRYVGNAWVRDDYSGDKQSQVAGLITFETVEESNGGYIHYWGHYPLDLGASEWFKIEDSSTRNLLTFLGWGYTMTERAIAFHSPYGIDGNKLFGLDRDDYKFRNFKAFDIWVTAFLERIVFEFESCLRLGKKPEKALEYVSMEEFEAVKNHLAYKKI